MCRWLPPACGTEGEDRSCRGGVLKFLAGLRFLTLLYRCLSRGVRVRGRLQIECENRSSVALP